MGWNVIPHPAIALDGVTGSIRLALIEGLPGRFGTEDFVNCGPIEPITAGHRGRQM